MTERNLTISDTVKIAVFTVLAVIGFFVLWGMTFILCFALTLNSGLSLLLGFLASAVTIFPLVAILIPHRKRVRIVLSKRQKIVVCVAWIIVFASTLPLIRISPRAFIGCLPGLMVAPLIVIIGTLRRGKEMAQK